MSATLLAFLLLFAGTETPIWEQAREAHAEFVERKREATADELGRAKIAALYSAAEEKLLEHRKKQPGDFAAQFLLAELFCEHAEMLVGASYLPAESKERKALYEANVKEADRLFARAIGACEVVVGRLARAPERARFDAEWRTCLVHIRRGKIAPAGPDFEARADVALEKADDFLAMHYESEYGALAMLEIGRMWREKALRLGSADDGAMAVAYLEQVAKGEDLPASEARHETVASAWLEYVRTCTAIATAKGELAVLGPAYVRKAIEAEKRIAELHRTKPDPALKKALEEIERAKKLTAK